MNDAVFECTTCMLSLCIVFLNVHTRMLSEFEHASFDAMLE